MDEKYAVSIIIPHYNSPDLLEKLLSTIPDNKEIQTIIVDDHSDEDVKNRLQEIRAWYSGSNMLFLENTTLEHNAGIARDIGLEYAEGKWLLFADSDDFFIPGFYDIIKEYLDTEYDMVFFQPTSSNLETGEMGERHQRYSEYIKEYLRRPCKKTEAHLRYNWAASWSKLIRTSMVQEHHIQFDHVPYSNDNVFSAKTGFYAREIAVSRETIYCVVYREGSLTTEMSRDAFDTRTQTKIRKYQFLKSHLSKEEFRDSDAYQLAIYQLLIILRRGYGIRCFTEYLKLFQKNGMLVFDIRMFNPVYLIYWIQDCIYENKSKKHMAEK